MKIYQVLLFPIFLVFGLVFMTSNSDAQVLKIENNIPVSPLVHTMSTIVKKSPMGKKSEKQPVIRNLGTSQRRLMFSGFGDLLMMSLVGLMDLSGTFLFGIGNIVSALRGESLFGWGVAGSIYFGLRIALGAWSFSQLKSISNSSNLVLSWFIIMPVAYLGLSVWNIVRGVIGKNKAQVALKSKNKLHFYTPLLSTPRLNSLVKADF